MQRTMRPIATAQTTYARGAAAPSDPATLAGRRKMPPPTVMLTIPAASATVPMARIGGCVDEEVSGGFAPGVWDIARQLSSPRAGAAARPARRIAARTPRGLPAAAHEGRDRQQILQPDALCWRDRALPHAR